MPATLIVSQPQVTRIGVGMCRDKNNHVAATRKVGYNLFYVSFPTGQCLIVAKIKRNVNYLELFLVLILIILTQYLPGSIKVSKMVEGFQPEMYQSRRRGTRGGP